MSGSSDLRARFIEHCGVNGLFAGRKLILAAVSGGADSVVLLRLLKDCSAALGVDVMAAHVNHIIRPEAGADADFVRRLAADTRIRFLCAEVDVPALAAERGLSLEAAGRVARYGELRRLARESGADAIATGHTMTDQAETILMRMIRGTGPLGLAGISSITDDGVVRPLLCVTAAEVRTFATDERISFVEDPSNSDEYYLRNKIRARLLPLLRELNPRVESRLSELADDAADVSLLVAELVDQYVTAADGDRCLISRRTPAAIVPYAVRSAFAQVTGEPLGLSRTHIDALSNALGNSTGPAEFHLPRRVVVFLRPEGLMFTRDLEGPPPGSARKDLA